MPSPLTQARMISLLADAEPRAFTLFLGAGASKSSGIPLASEMIRDWRQKKFSEEAPPGSDFQTWCLAQDWYSKDTEYSLLFESLYPDEYARQRYIQSKVEGVFPGWGYLYLANLIRSGRFNVCFTTNFDDLLRQALNAYAGYNPLVCSAESQIMSISLTSDRAKIIKLHGDYLFKRLKNTPTELAQLDPNMQRKFRQFAQQCGTLALGYAGLDVSIMSILEKLLEESEDTFPSGIYWGVRQDSKPSAALSCLLEKFPTRVHLFQLDDFDTFMACFNAKLNLELPEAILKPFDALRQRYALLTKTETTDTKSDARIDADRQALMKQLILEWAQPGADAQLDLLQAQLALGRRDYQAALNYITRFNTERPDDIDGLTTLGLALFQQAEENAAGGAIDAAIEKWRAAVTLEAKNAPRKAIEARKGLVRALSRKQKWPEAIAESEALLAYLPLDCGLHEVLCQLYVGAGRLDNALTQIQWLLQRDPDNSQYHFNHAAVLEQKGMVNEALAELDIAVRFDPSNAWIHFSRGNILFRLGRMDEAGNAFEQAARLAPQNSNFRLQMAALYTGRQMLAAALPHLETAVRLEPNSAETHGWLGQTYLALGRFPEAERELQTMVSLGPGDVRAEVMLGVTLLRTGRPDAESHFRNAIRISPNEPRAWYWLGILLRMQNRQQEWNPVYQRLTQLDQSVAQMLQWQSNNWQAAAPYLFNNPAFSQPQFGAPAFPQNEPGVPQANPGWKALFRQAFGQS